LEPNDITPFHLLMFQLQELLPKKQEQQLADLRHWMDRSSSLCIAYSGGVDSTLVAAIAYECKGESAFAVTGVSPALAPHLLQEARHQAGWIGIRHQELPTAELEDPDYSSNPVDRCFACKRELHRHLKPIATAAGDALVIDGVNLDDLGDHRPGIDAARQAGVRSPLAELKIDKATIRQLSRALGSPGGISLLNPVCRLAFPMAKGSPRNVSTRWGKPKLGYWLGGLTVCAFAATALLHELKSLRSRSVP